MIIFFVLLFFRLVHQRQTTSATVLSIEMVGHKHAGTAFHILALTAKSSDFSIIVHFVEFQHTQLDLLLLVFILLWGGVVLLLSLLGTTGHSYKVIYGALVFQSTLEQGLLIIQQTARVC